jgi:hypothetical protein
MGSEIQVPTRWLVVFHCKHTHPHSYPASNPALPQLLGGGLYFKVRVSGRISGELANPDVIVLGDFWRKELV